MLWFFYVYHQIPTYFADIAFVCTQQMNMQIKRRVLYSVKYMPVLNISLD